MLIQTVGIFVQAIERRREARCVDPDVNLKCKQIVDPKDAVKKNCKRL